MKFQLTSAETAGFKVFQEQEALKNKFRARISRRGNTDRIHRTRGCLDGHLMEQ